MLFARNNYGMNKGIPFIKIADHIDVNFHLKGKRVGGRLSRRPGQRLQECTNAGTQAR